MHSNYAFLLTPAETLAHFRRKDRHWLKAAVNRGLIEAVNVGGQGNGARYLYRLKHVEPITPEPDLEELHWGRVKRGHGL